MNLVNYLNNMSDKRGIGLVCQFVISGLSVYAGTIYPPHWIAKKTIIDYFPSVIPFAVVVTMVVALIFVRETKVVYPDELECFDESNGETE
jgi:hypothetical protein